ncbi:HU family DNA-binding protein [Candidatus Gromoviella agglomerans]|uniref:HU family DNA-binding protein n=1 Tax=Candidatus Gromoviella agglomerans TaxID=2806609 RepID=UPI001E2C703B|nr:HU family DNA-binding protein [Candidatus Gromoviella agglomerans]UFX98606.1 HU family DNA-binding protein [Candidatus Gromoviella agglomerans]
MSKSITRADLIKILVNKFNLSKEEASVFLKEIIFSVCAALKDSGSLNISSFGKFVISHRPERSGTNPKTGDKIRLEEKKILKFKPSVNLKHKVNRQSLTLVR